MAGRDEHETIEAVERTERIWIALAFGLIATFIVLVFFAIGVHGAFVGETESRQPVEAILAQPGFQNPGVEQTGPDEYRAHVVARAFAFQPAVIEVPKGATVDFRLTSTDVIHGFNVAGTTINVELIPGEVSRLEYTFDKAGEYPLICNQYCGIGHQNMINTVRVIEAEASQDQPAADEPVGEETVASGESPRGAEHEQAGAGTEKAGDDGAEASDQPAWFANGKTVFGNRCASCHQADGSGIPGAFPPLADHAQHVVKAEGGREYMIQGVLYGIQGQIQVHGQSYNQRMMSLGDLSNDDIADVLNYAVHAWGNGDQLPDDFEPVSADDVAAQRDKGLSAGDVHSNRPALDNQ
jgi:cytochrome c oxidase subunit 2